MSPEQYVRSVVAYDGTDFSGFQIQERLDGTTGHPVRRGHGQYVRTVQGVLEEALAQVTRERIRLVGAGRTDAGVHALGQVVSFTVHWRHSLADLYRAWNAVLPQDVVVLSLCLAQKGFHPRFDATSRVYRYTIWNHPVRNPLLRRTALWVSDSLDIASMSEALDLLVGEHDFATFGTAPGGGRTTVRRVHCVKCYASGQVGPWDNHLGCMPEQISIRPVRHQIVGLDPMVYVDIEANAFLYRMVRSIVGTILQVGRGQLSVAEFASVLAAAERSRAGPTAPPHGLCLVAVKY